jgi:hypothetical protein
MDFQSRKKTSLSFCLIVLFSFGSGAMIVSRSVGAESSRRYITPNAFEGTDTQRINRAIEVAAREGCRVVIPRVNRRKDGVRHFWLLDSAVLVRSGTTLELDHCCLKLSDRCRDNFIRSANCGLARTDIEPMRDIHIYGSGPVLLEGADHPRATGDAAKTLGKRTFGTDAGVEGESQTGDWRNIGILMAYVEHFSIENLRIKNSHSWAISLERCAHGRLRDLDFDSKEFRRIDGKREKNLNQDGIDLRLGCHDILIENITGNTGDDLIALTAIPGNEKAGTTSSMMVSGNTDRGDGRDAIRDVIVRNVRGYSHGGHHIIRLLNTGGVHLHDILIASLIDTSPKEIRCKAAVKIGDHHYGAGIAPLGDTYRIIIDGVTSKARNTILIGGSLSDSILSRLIRYGGPGTLVHQASGTKHVRNVTISQCREME